ncbi:MAG: quinate 5-dehydrogenase [Fimbriimonadaceae bacterium]
MKRVVSISLGAAKGDKVHEAEVLGETFRIERIGADGDIQRFADLFRELDGKVAAIGIGGADRYVVVDDRRYAFRQIDAIASRVTRTPVVDGSGLKHTLEREAIRTLQRDGTVDFRHTPTLMVSAVDRFGMAQALDEIGGPVVYGDVMFGLGLPIRLRSYRAVRTLGRLLLPIVTRLPFQWFYPTGEKQVVQKTKCAWAFQEAEVIAGDKHIIFRNAPPDLAGKTILTQSVRKHDLEWMRSAGVARVIVTTPVMGGETFATNVMEALLVASLGRQPDALTEADYLDWLDQLNWKPTVMDLAPRL